MTKPNQRFSSGWILTGCLLLSLLGLVVWFVFVGQAEQKLILDLNDVAEADCDTAGFLPVDWAWIRPFNERLKSVITDMPDEAIPLVRNHPRIKKLRLYGSSPLEMKDLGTLPKLEEISLGMPVHGCENFAVQFPRARTVSLPMDDHTAKALADQPEAWRNQIRVLEPNSPNAITQEGFTTLRAAFPYTHPWSVRQD